jgi:hypothetical protein
MPVDRPVHQRVRCSTCGVDFDIVRLRSPARLTFDISLWQERCATHERSSPFCCSSFARQLEELSDKEAAE